MTGNDERKISSLRDLPRDIAPPRDLWQGIEARLDLEPNHPDIALCDSALERFKGGSAISERGVHDAEPVR